MDCKANEFISDCSSAPEFPQLNNNPASSQDGYNQDLHFPDPKRFHCPLDPVTTVNSTTEASLKHSQHELSALYMAGAAKFIKGSSTRNPHHGNSTRDAGTPSVTSVAAGPDLGLGRLGVESLLGLVTVHVLTADTAWGCCPPPPPPSSSCPQHPACLRRGAFFS